MKADDLGNRMKKYENVARNYLTRKIPVIIRIDGKAFHTLTKGFQKPFDDLLIKVMHETAKYLCSNIQGCKMAYTQSDEISLLLTDFEKINTDGWFDYNIQKMASVSASMATLKFNRAYNMEIENEHYNNEQFAYHNYCDKVALFDSRVFNLPKEEVCNYFIWRQEDATRNSIQMVAQSKFSHKQLQGLNCNQLQEKLFQEKAINWNDLPVYQKRGVCINKKSITKNATTPKGDILVKRSIWSVDENIPIFTRDRNYINGYFKQKNSYLGVFLLYNFSFKVFEW